MKRTALKQICCTAALLFSLPFFAEEVQYCRIRPSEESACAGTCTGPVNILGKIGDWRIIAAPSDIPVWISTSFLLENGTLAPGVIFRMAPTAASGTFNTLPGSEKIIREPEILERVKNNTWARIRIKDTIAVYLKPEEKPPVPEKEKNIAGPYLSMDGILLPLAEPVSGATHKLVFRVNGKDADIICVRPGKIRLSLWENLTVRIDGATVFSRQHNKLLLTAEKVSPLWD